MLQSESGTRAWMESAEKTVAFLYADEAGIEEVIQDEQAESVKILAHVDDQPRNRTIFMYKKRSSNSTILPDFIP